MLMFIVLVIAIGLFLLFFFAKKTDATSDYSHPYSSTTSNYDSVQNNNDQRVDDCGFNADPSSDSSSCDSGNND